MKSFYFLTAVGPDRPGLVALVTGVLFSEGCNIEDSSMMRLGSEFGMFAIFTSNRRLDLPSVLRHRAFRKILVDIKPITAREASFVGSKRDAWIVRVHGADQAGLVFRVTQCLAKFGFNITDLTTHRIGSGRRAGYILFIEGEPARSSTASLRRSLAALATKLNTNISFEPIASTRF